MKRGNYIGIVGLFLVLITASALLPSCREKPAVTEQIVVTAIGIEKKQQQVQLSIQAIESLKTSASLSEQNESATAVYEAEGKSVSEALQSFLNEAGRSTYILHNQIIALGETIAQENHLFETMDYFLRNPEGRALVDVVICRGNPQSLLSIESGNDAIPAEYVAQLLREGERVGTGTLAQLLDIQRCASGMYDAMIPIVEIQEKTPRLKGTALFKNGYMTGELDEQQTTALLYAANRIKTCLHTVDGVTFRVVRSSTKTKIVPHETGFGYYFSIDSRVDIVESDHVLKSEEKEALLKRLEENCAAKIEETLKKTVGEYGCDPLGLARQTAKEYPNVTQEEAVLLLKQAQFEAQVKVRLVESGFLR